jgi:hypothetical protein
MIIYADCSRLNLCLWLRSKPTERVKKNGKDREESMSMP